jgi:L-fuculose-phosphate aldolase
MSEQELALRKAIIAKCRWMNATGLNQGTSGNISARHGETMLITPSAIPYEAMEPEMIAAMPLRFAYGDAGYGSWEGPLKPSTEWRFHYDILMARPEIAAIVHTHSIYATTLAMCRKGIPAAHYMVSAFGGADVRCGGYARYGTKELSDIAVAALEDRTGCLLANHGMIALGTSLDKAMWTAVELETLARMYYQTLAIGGPVILSDAQIAETKSAMKGYGLQDPPVETLREAPAAARARSRAPRR